MTANSLKKLKLTGPTLLGRGRMREEALRTLDPLSIMEVDEAVMLAGASLTRVSVCVCVCARACVTCAI